MSPCNSTHTFRSLRSHPNSAQILAAAEHCGISNSTPTATQMARRNLQTAPLRAVQPWPRLAPAASPANHMWPSVPPPFPFYPTASYVRACAAASSPILLLCSSCRNAWRRRNLRKRPRRRAQIHLQILLVRSSLTSFDIDINTRSWSLRVCFAAPRSPGMREAGGESRRGGTKSRACQTSSAHACSPSAVASPAPPDMRQNPFPAPSSYSHLSRALLTALRLNGNHLFGACSQRPGLLPLCARTSSCRFPSAVGEFRRKLLALIIRRLNKNFSAAASQLQGRSSEPSRVLSSCGYPSVIFPHAASKQ